MKKISLYLFGLYLCTFGLDMNYKKTTTYHDENNFTASIEYKKGFGGTLRKVTKRYNDQGEEVYIVNGFVERDRFYRPVKKYMPVPLSKAEYNNLSENQSGEETRGLQQY